MQMRTSLVIDEALLAKARDLTGITDPTELVNAGLKLLVARDAASRLAALGGTMPKLVVPRRRRP